MHTIDIIIVIAYLALCILIGLYKSRSIQTLKEYTLGKGYFPDIVIITTIFATYIGADSVVGNIGQVYKLGMFFAITRVMTPLFWLIMIKVYAKNIDQFHGCMSTSDIMERLYGSVGRWSTNIVAVFFAIGTLAMQSSVLGHIFNYFFQIPYVHGVVFGTTIITLYSCFGGIRAVALTDVFQFAIFVVALPVICAFAYNDVGRYDGIMFSLPQEYFTININKDNVWLFISLIFYSFLPTTSGVYMQRFLIAKNSAQLINCIKTICYISIPFVSIICLISFIIKIKAPDINPDTAFIYFIAHYTPIGIKGLLITGLLAMIMSTADSWLNTASVLLTHDIIRKLIPLNEKQSLLTARFGIVVIGFLSILLASYEKGIMELEWLGCNFWDPIVLAPLTIGFLKFRTNSKSFIVAITVAILSTAISGYIVGDLATISLMCGMIGSAIGLFGMHYWQIYQGTFNIHTHPTKLINTNINENANMDRKTAPAASQSRRMFEDEEEKTKIIADELKKQSFIQGVEQGRLAKQEEVAKNLLLQGLDISIIENATGLSREDLATLQKSIKTAN